jgi:hypothetical protein
MSLKIYFKEMAPNLSFGFQKIFKSLNLLKDLQNKSLLKLNIE